MVWNSTHRSGNTYFKEQEIFLWDILPCKILAAVSKKPKISWRKNKHEQKKPAVPFSDRKLCCCCFGRSWERNPHPFWPGSNNSLFPAGSWGREKSQHSRACHEKWWQSGPPECLPHPCGAWREWWCDLEESKEVKPVFPRQSHNHLDLAMKLDGGFTSQVWLLWTRLGVWRRFTTPVMG